MSPVCGIIGAGKLGIALAKAAVARGLEVWITSRDLASTRLIAAVMAPGTQVGTLEEVVARSALVILALPLHRLGELPADAFDGKVLVDAVNHWEPVDGPMSRYGVSKDSTTELVKSRFPRARLVKGLNQLGYHDVEDGGRTPGASDRLGIAVAGDDEGAKQEAMDFIDRLGFDPVDGGSLADGVRLGPGGPAFGALLSARDLRLALGR